MSNSKFYAVVTGDIVGSSKINTSQWSHFLSTLKNSFKITRDLLPDGIHAPFKIHQGDSFQGVLSKPETALRAVIIIRANLRHGFETKKRRSALDARIAVGVGQIDYLPDTQVSEGKGDAFLRSGTTLKKMKGDRRLLIRTPWPEIDEELDIECALFDALVNRWSAEQAEAILGRMKGLIQDDLARELGISQVAVQQRLKGAGESALISLCSRYERMICKRISPEDYNDNYKSEDL